MEALTTHYYLGANTPEGFYSLYDKYLTENDRLLIIKGSPGCGKSTFMKKIAQEMANEGLETELIHCSGDPDSLDGVYLPELNIAFADGTAPHVLEPDYAGVKENYINFGVCLDMDALWDDRENVIDCNKKYKREYVKAYNALAAAKASHMGVLDELIDENVKTEVIKKATRLAAKEFKKNQGQSKIKERFTDALTCKGWIHRYDTIAALADKIYLVDTAFGLNYLFVETITEKAIENGWDVIICRDALYPKHISHVIMPQASVAIVSRYGSEFPDWQAKMIHLDSIPGRAGVKAVRDQMRGRKRMWDELISDTQGFLAKAKEYHDQLENAYRPHADFNMANKLTDEYLAMLRAKIDLM